MDMLQIGGKNVFTGPYAALEYMLKAALTINCMGCNGSKLVNSWDNDTHITAKERLNNLCYTIEHIYKPESSTVLSRYQFSKLQCEKRPHS